MSVQNTVFNNMLTPVRTVYGNNLRGLDRANLTNEQSKEFNTYKYWKPFAVPTQPSMREDGEMDATQHLGVKSLFSPFNAIYTFSKFREDANMPLLDTPDSRKKIKSNTACTIKDLVDASEAGKMGRQIYTYSDFAYCKYLGRIPNNYLITLRRFAAPCGDRIDKRNYIDGMEKKIQKHMPDIGRLVTWMGTPGNDMSNILKYTVGMQWKKMEAGIDQQDGGGDSGGPLQGIFNMASGKYRQQVMQGIAGQNFAGKTYMDGMLGGSGATNPPYSNAEWLKNYDNTKVYGPVDVIAETTMRERGLKFEQNFSLVFDYELRSYGGVNGKSAMVDLLANILTTTYALGTFWGGERKFIGAAQNNIFANLPIFKLAEQGGLNNFSNVYQAFVDSVHDGAAAFTNGIKGDTTLEKIKNFAKDLGGMLLGGMLNKLGRPQKFAFSSLLSPAPTGCWHLTIGNPRSPILEVGNLICDGATVEHYGPLGLDNFPTGLRVTVNLKHGKPRDIMGVEQMYLRGDTRIYAPMGKDVMRMYENASQLQSNKNTNPVEEAQKKKLEELQENMSDPSEGRILSSQEISTINALSEALSELMGNNQKSDPKQDEVLIKYFGMTEKGTIVKASMESLYGSEKHKNDHVGSNPQPK